MTTTQKALSFAILTALIATGVYEGRRISQLQSQVATLSAERSSLTERLQTDRGDAAKESAAAPKQATQPSVDDTELVKLRYQLAKLQGVARENARLKAAAEATDNDQVVVAMKSWGDRVKKLKDKLDQAPARRIPEFQFLTDQDWFNAIGKSGQLETDADFDHALSSLKTAAKDQFADLTQAALRKYAEANNGQSPANMAQLQPYYGTTVDDSVLQRYQFGQSGTVSQVATSADDDNEAYYQITANTINSSSKAEDALQPALDAYAAANSGQLPANPSQLLPYARTPEEQAALQKLTQSPGAK
ncbi:MAG TPA: hypothetical protein VGO67_20490 [Verrucomicrobiae bacterium]